MNIRTMEAPSKDWCRNELESLQAVILVFVTSVQIEKILEGWHDNSVCFTTSEGELTANVYIQGGLSAEKAVNPVLLQAIFLKMHMQAMLAKEPCTFKVY